MTRRVASLILVVGLTGCAGSGGTASLDPFARTRIQPPKTGRIATPSNDPYYTRLGMREASPESPAPSSSWTAASAGPAPPTASTPEHAPRDLRIAGSGDQVAIPLAARTPPEQTQGSAPNEDSPPRSLAKTASAESTPPDREVKTIPIRPREPAIRIPTEVSGVASRPFGDMPSERASPGGVVDIAELPPPGTTSQARPVDSGIRLASATEELTEGRGGDSFSSASRYGYDPEYRWLRGKLEYSQIDHRWKLRYIPIDGKTDEFGGSVTFVDATSLGDCRAGEYVEVQGRLGPRPEDDRKGFAPEFEVSGIRRLGG